LGAHYAALPDLGAETLTRVVESVVAAGPPS